ncbi:MAG: polysaccharide deacetylase [Peptococcaceae bacterium]|nr:polysaccharide deacetylase [Peptococcaceae bacterium]
MFWKTLSALTISAVLLTTLAFTGTPSKEEPPDLVSITPVGALEKELVRQPPLEENKKITTIPILMYHVIEDYSGPYEQLYTSPQILRKQLAFLKEQGFSAVTVHEALNHWKKDTPLPAKPIILTFDDGYRSVYTEAFPLLKEYGFRATLYLHTAKINTPGGLTTEMTKEMAGYGLEIGSHSLTHPDLTKISPAKLRNEIRLSKKQLEELTGQEVTTFCYPAGRYNSRVREEVMKAGYLGAVTTRYGPATNRENLYSLSRIRINKSDLLQGFINKLNRY